ncbi:MAG TPA: hypothetical protein VFO76_09295, partial [Candidatus Kapabacteria bacterium]|nr:hypothetical protein [Candidatus Kapabacteria bacterium]
MRIAKALNSSTSIAVAVTIPVLLMIGMTLVIPVGGDDGWIHLNWIPQFTHLVKEGYLQPRWLPDSFGGYGIPAFYFYPPLPYWFITVVSVIIPSASSSALLYITCLFGSIISVLTLFLYLKQLQISRVSALLGAIMYGFGTYRLLDIFSRNALGEQFAFAFLPLIFLSIELAASDNPRNRMRSFFIGLAGWIGLLLTNIPCVIIAGLAMIVYCLARGTLFQPRRWVLILVPIVGAACCTAFYLLPLAHFRTQVQLDQLWIYGSSGEGFTYLRQEYYDLRSTKTLMIAVGILTAVILQRMLHRNAAPRQAKVIFWLLVLSVGLQLPFIGVILHSIVFPLTILQFYWRWDVLLLLALCSTFS